jgi:hypothetical protein
MGSLVQLIVAGVLLATVLGGIYAAWSSFKDHIGTPYAEAQRVADQAIVDKANAAQRAAESERDNAVADTAACVAQAAKQSDAVDRWKLQADRNAAAAREAKAQAQREATAAAPKIAELQANAAAAPKLMVCEEELGKAKAVLQDSLRARREIPGVVK